jgi:extracellular factor (EF) 3-hydroxypalmitic acid methyl ester biosynthesis protein
VAVDECRASSAHACDREILDACCSHLEAGCVEPALDELFLWLNTKRRMESGQSWSRWVRTSALRHPIQRLLHSEPFTAAAFRKPRGFAGDAGTLDFLYAANLTAWQGLRPALTSPLAAAMHAYITTRRPSAHAVAGRCRFFADAIDDTASRLSRGDLGRVLSIAAGHFRESALSAALRSGRISELVVLDQDKEAINEIVASCSGLPVAPIHASIRGVLGNGLRLGEFDLIYAGGLFDYLARRTAIALLDALVCHLRPDGRILIANFVPDHPDRGYMESFMDWHLVYRSQADMFELSRSLRTNELVSARTWLDGSGSLAFLELRKARHRRGMVVGPQHTAISPQDQPRRPAVSP